MIQNIKDILALVLPACKETLGSFPNDESLKNLGLDSINLMQVIILLEDNFSIELNIDDYFLEKIDTIEKIKNTIERYC